MRNVLAIITVVGFVVLGGSFAQDFSTGPSRPSTPFRVAGKREAVVRVSTAGAIQDGDLNDLTIARTGAGLYSITSTTWDDFAIFVTARTSQNNNTRDQRKVAYFAIANGYQLRITLDDNGGAADTLDDEEFMLFAREY